MTRRWAAAAAVGVVGPATFVAAWAVLGARTAGYDPTRDAISTLAAVDASTRHLMTAGLAVLGTGMVLYAGALRKGLGGPAWIAALANGITTFGIAALPLGSTYDTPHGVAAGLGYATLAAIPLLAAPRLAGAGRPGWAAASRALGVVSGLCLAASVVGDWRTGLLQRLGLTLAHAWVVASAVSLARGPMSSSTTPPAPAPAGRRR